MIYWVNSTCDLDNLFATLFLAYSDAGRGFFFDCQYNAQPVNLHFIPKTVALE